MNQWVRFHREVLEEERQEAALATRAEKASRTQADSAVRTDEPTRDHRPQD